MTDLGAFIIVFVLALSVSLALSPAAAYVGQRFNIVAVPGGRRQHAGHISKLGSIALYAGFTAAVLVAQLLPVPRMDPYEIVRLSGLLIGGALIFIVGLLDDILDFRPLTLFIGQSITAAIAILFQIFIEYVNNPFTGQQTESWHFVVTVTLSYFWLVSMMNTVNFLDGLDGLAGGVAFIAGTLLFINSAFRVQPAQTSVSMLHLALMGCSLGFLLYNFHPAHVFMGGGAYFLGYTLGTLSIIGGAKMAVILLVMGLPLLDVAWQATNRLRQGRSPFEGDRGHLHFRLLDRGFSQRQIVLGYYVFCASFGALTLLIDSQLYKFIALSAMILLVIIGFILLSRLNHTPPTT